MLRGSPGVATPGAFLFWGYIVNRTACPIDGFNPHCALVDAERQVGLYRRWLELDGRVAGRLVLVVA